MGAVANPGDGGGIERGEALGVSEGEIAVVDGPCKNDEVGVLFEAVAVFLAVVEIHVIAGRE